jgi:hypothetical protein
MIECSEIPEKCWKRDARAWGIVEVGERRDLAEILQSRTPQWYQDFDFWLVEGDVPVSLELRVTSGGSEVLGYWRLRFRLSEIEAGATVVKCGELSGKGCPGVMMQFGIQRPLPGQPLLESEQFLCEPIPVELLSG